MRTNVLTSMSGEFGLHRNRTKKTATVTSEGARDRKLYISLFILHALPMSMHPEFLFDVFHQ